MKTRTTSITPMCIGLVILAVLVRVVYYGLNPTISGVWRVAAAVGVFCLGVALWFLGVWAEELDAKNRSHTRGMHPPGATFSSAAAERERVVEKTPDEKFFERFGVERPQPNCEEEAKVVQYLINHFSDLTTFLRDQFVRNGGTYETYRDIFVEDRGEGVRRFIRDIPNPHSLGHLEINPERLDEALIEFVPSQGLIKFYCPNDRRMPEPTIFATVRVRCFTGDAARFKALRQQTDEFYGRGFMSSMEDWYVKLVTRRLSYNHTSSVLFWDFLTSLTFGKSRTYERFVENDYAENQFYIYSRQDDSSITFLECFFNSQVLTNLINLRDSGRLVTLQ